MAPIIRVRGIGKQYRIGRRATSGLTVGETIGNMGRAVARRFAGGPPPEERTIWAVRDVTFDVEPGEVLGIVGRNGAGKSTLLKLLSRVTRPTRGFLELYGRSSSLLEVGTGFHPELTGRENIYLNGVILGMSYREVRGKLDEIVAFSEIDEFLDTPVKRYSSGMYVRLAFAVAAHLDPEILIVDEVLAVGDLRFQRKCLGRMSEAARGGRTVLFVSHNLDAVARLCTRALLLESGQIVRQGAVDEVVSEYVSVISAQPDSPFEPVTDPTGRITVARIRQCLPDGSTVTRGLMVGESWELRVEINIAVKLHSLTIGFGLRSYAEVAAGTSWAYAEEIQPGRWEAVFNAANRPLAPGRYHICIGVSLDGALALYLDPAGTVEVLPISALPHTPAISGAGAFLDIFPAEVRRLEDAPGSGLVVKT
jgi:lipopolysaccharide transport system ATP-binding protein